MGDSSLNDNGGSTTQGVKDDFSPLQLQYTHHNAGNCASQALVLYIVPQGQGLGCQRDAHNQAMVIQVNVDLILWVSGISSPTQGSTDKYCHLHGGSLNSQDKL